MKVLEFATKSGTLYEIHMLNPGQSFPGFGGSSCALPITKTASCIVRERSVWGWRDTEYDIDDETLWKWIASVINLGHDEGVVAKACDREPPPKPEPSRSRKARR